jgi:hypothetical protein
MKCTGDIQLRAFLRPRAYRRASTRCCSQLASISSAWLLEYTIAGKVRINSRQVENTISPALPSFFNSKRACMAAIPASRLPAPFSAAFHLHPKLFILIGAPTAHPSVSKRRRINNTVQRQIIREYLVLVSNRYGAINPPNLPREMFRRHPALVQLRYHVDAIVNLIQRQP